MYIRFNDSRPFVILFRYYGSISIGVRSCKTRLTNFLRADGITNERKGKQEEIVCPPEWRKIDFTH